MWKMAVAFALFAAVALFVLMKGGGNVDLAGEKHDVAAPHEPAASAAAAVEAASTAASTPASAASQ